MFSHTYVYVYVFKLYIYIVFTLKKSEYKSGKLKRTPYYKGL